MLNKKKAFFICAYIILSCFFLFSDIHNDEAYNYLSCDYSFKEVMFIDVNFPYYQALIVCPLKKAGFEILGLRMVNILMSLFGFLLIFRLISYKNYFFNVFLALNPFFIKWLVFAKQYSLLLFTFSMFLTIEDFISDEKIITFYEITLINACLLMHPFSFFFLPCKDYYLKRINSILDLLTSYMSLLIYGFPSIIILYLIKSNTTSYHWQHFTVFGFFQTIVNVSFVIGLFTLIKSDNLAENIKIPIQIFLFSAFFGFVIDIWHYRYLVLGVPLFIIMISKLNINVKSNNTKIAMIGTILILLSLNATVDFKTPLFEASHIKVEKTIIHESTFSYYPMKYYNPKPQYILKDHKGDTPILNKSEIISKPNEPFILITDKKCLLNYYNKDGLYLCDVY